MPAPGDQQRSAVKSPVSTALVMTPNRVRIQCLISHVMHGADYLSS